MSLAFVSQLAPLPVMPSAQAADFSRAKKIFVPPTRIPRRFDSESASSESDSYGTSDPGYSTPSSYTPQAGKASGKYGLVPPPPPQPARPLLWKMFESVLRLPPGPDGPPLPPAPVLLLLTVELVIVSEPTL